MYSWNVMEILMMSLLLALLLVVILVLGLRWFKYRERMAALQRTAVSAELFAEDTPEQRRKRQLANGLTTALVGLALTIGLGTLGVGPWLLAGLIPLFVGLSLILTYLITQPEKPTDASVGTQAPEIVEVEQPPVEKEEAGPEAEPELVVEEEGEEEKDEDAGETYYEDVPF